MALIRRLTLGLVLLCAVCGHAEAAPRTPPHATMTAVPPALEGRPMSAQERADILAMDAETKPDAAYELDLTTPLHYRYAMAMLARSGESAAKSPELFRRLNHAHMAMRPANAKPRMAKLATVAADTQSNLNFIASFSVGAANTYQATGLSSVIGGTQVTNVIMELYNVQTGTVFATQQGRTTQYSQGTDFRVTAEGKSPPGIQDTTTRAVGLFTYVPVSGGDPVVVRYSTIDTVNPSSPCMLTPNYCVRDSNNNCVSGQYQTACTNTVSNTNQIKACWNRGSQQECDYWNSTPHPTNFTFPMSGSVAYPNNTVVTPLTGFVYIALQNPLRGGGCNVYFQQAGTLDPQYWKLNGTTVSWTYPAAAFANTGNCINYYDGTSTNLWMRGNVLLQGQPNQPPPFGSINFTSDRNQIGVPGVSIIPGMYIMQGCFAAGTPILQGDGTPRKIEDFTAAEGESVMSGDGNPLMVSGTTKGTEPFKKMVRIRTTRGHQIMVTETHPIILADGTPVMAKDLKVGQEVKTREGTAVVNALTREAYAGKVYNVRLGDPVTTNEKGSTLYAGGILTGDSRMQNYYARLEKEKLARDPQEVLKRLPNAWLQDFKNHQ